jgi:hypothetical protein
MGASAEMIDASGVRGVMAGAAAIRQSDVAAARAAGAFADPASMKPWRERADEILKLGDIPDLQQKGTRLE